MNLYQQCKIFQPWVENVKCMKVRLVFQGCFTGVMFVFRWYSMVFRLCFEVVCCSTTVPECSTVLPVFRILLFRWFSVFRCSVFWLSWFYSMPSLSSIFDCSYRYVGFGRFILSSYKENTKKLSLKSKYKYIKKHYDDRDSTKKLQSFISIACP